MPKCLSCGCEINENNEASDALYKDGYCHACSLAEEHQSKEDALLYDTYISTLYMKEKEVNIQEDEQDFVLEEPVNADLEMNEEDE